MMRIEIRENGVVVNVPEAKYFRLDEVANATIRTTLGLKDMDVGWFETASSTWFLVEQKAYYDPQNPQHRPPEYFSDSKNNTTSSSQELLKDFLKKALDSLLLLLPERSSVHQNLIDSLALPGLISENHNLAIVFLLRLPPEQSHKLLALQTQFSHLIKPLKETFNIRHVAIMDYDQFSGDEKFPWLGPLPTIPSQKSP